MRLPIVPKKMINSKTYSKFCSPVDNCLLTVPVLKSRGDRPLKMTFEDQLNALIFFHLQEHDSARHLIQELNEDEFAREFIAPDGGISRSSFSEAINHRGLEQLQHVFQELSKQSSLLIPKGFQDLGDLIAIDGSLIDAVLTMYWADYRKGSKKAKGHFGFDINRGVPTKVCLTDGNGGERPFVSQILSAGQTGVLDRGYQSHKLFDLLQQEDKSFVCRIKVGTTKTIINSNPVNPESYVFYDALVNLGTPGINRTETPVRVVGYKVDGVNYYVATDRFDLAAEQVATIYKLRWSIETFFKWWKKHLHVYHLIAQSEYGLMVQILGGLITYMLMAIYCQENFQEKVSIYRFRQIRIAIQNELRSNLDVGGKNINAKDQWKPKGDAST